MKKRSEFDANQATTCRRFLGNVCIATMHIDLNSNWSRCKDISITTFIYYRL